MNSVEHDYCEMVKNFQYNSKEYREQYNRVQNDIKEISKKCLKFVLEIGDYKPNVKMDYVLLDHNVNDHSKVDICKKCTGKNLGDKIYQWIYECIQIMFDHDLKFDCDSCCGYADINLHTTFILDVDSLDNPIIQVHLDIENGEKSFLEVHELMEDKQ